MFRNLFRRKPTPSKATPGRESKAAQTPDELDPTEESAESTEPERPTPLEEEEAAEREPQPKGPGGREDDLESAPPAGPDAGPDTVEAAPGAEDIVPDAADSEEAPAADLPAVTSEGMPLESPEKRGFLRRLMDGLSKTRATLTRQVSALLSIGRAIDEDLLEELEEVLIQADVGIATTMHLVQRLRDEAAGRQLRDAAELQPLLRSEIEAIVGGDDSSVDIETAKPFVLLVVGVNGVGKTTTIGKLAARWTGEGKKVVIAAGDTFRAAAIEQLEVWAQRAGADLISQEQGSDAASVVYDAVHAANARKADVLIIDTAGRLHTKKNLMQELEKINRVATREVEGAPHEVLLVLDATTGQNAVEQARQFSQITPVTGIALTKLDSSAKGGVVIAVRHELDIPVKLIGIGEQIDDLRDFDGAAFVDALLAAEDS
ncbi:signal recognition particle-docking protein FtsY [Candidatus Poribacteria bacterium]|nr:signal recognition particle-docking protein FtsY [Candidatus Poribacteria bacterium]